ncbi:putative F-box protein [Sesamum alatum]|uniref:Endoplasmic reticulum transmembrane protein n=1 Tax=Sesamum alatum TaxID=300844 RepID=A0AAE2CGJ2_9LAMI|nr:putative F-box protein [Sesamum alatum]
MVFEMYRSNAGSFKLMEESIKSNLREEHLGRTENGEVFEMKVGLQLGRSLSELRDLAAAASVEGGDFEEFASKLFYPRQNLRRFKIIEADRRIRTARMIQVLFALIFAEMALIVLFIVKTPLRKPVIMGLDQIKRGSGPVVVKTVGGTVFVVMVASVYNAVAIKRREMRDGNTNSTDQILCAMHLLEASLMGFSLFLTLMIDRLHHYIRELRIRRKSIEALKKQNQALEDEKPAVFKEIKAMEEEKATLRGRIEELETQLEEKSKEASRAGASVVALKKQSDGFLIEYERLLEENQKLRSQVQSLDRKFSYSDIKKFL